MEPKAVEPVAVQPVAVEPVAVEPVAVEPVGSCEKVDPLPPALPCRAMHVMKTNAKESFTPLSDSDINSRIDMLKYIRLD